MERERTLPYPVRATPTLPTRALEADDAARATESSPSEMVARAGGAVSPVSERVGGSTDAASTNESGHPGGTEDRSEQKHEPLELVLALVRSTMNGLRSERLQERLGMPKEALTRVLKQGLATGQLTATGKARATVYSAVESPSSPTPTPWGSTVGRSVATVLQKLRRGRR